jgi:glycosyltransferase involved in cell wall biosynthesis
MKLGHAVGVIEGSGGPRPRPCRLACIVIARAEGNSALHVLVAHSRYLSGSVSGENSVVDDEIRLLEENGHRVTVVDPQAVVEGRAQRLATGVRTIWNLQAGRILARRLHLDRPDVVHFHNLFPALSPAVLRTAAGAGVPVVMTLHNYRLLCLPGTLLRDGSPCEDCLGRLPWRGVSRRCFRGSAAASGSYATSLGLHRATGTFDSVDRFIAVSEFVRAKHIEAGFSSNRITVKPNFAWDGPRRRAASGYFLFLGRLSDEKGVRVLVEACRHTPATVLIAGDGPERAGLERDAPERVTFLGAVTPQRARELLAGARALLVPSICYEGAPRTVIEAFAAGVPVVASDIGGLPDMVTDGSTGRLVAPGVSSEWANAIEALDCEETVTRLGGAARAEWERRYSPERAIEQLESVYLDAGVPVG